MVKGIYLINSSFHHTVTTSLSLSLSLSFGLCETLFKALEKQGGNFIDILFTTKANIHMYIL
jgi:hypothetical protein